MQSREFLGLINVEEGNFSISGSLEEKQKEYAMVSMPAGQETIISQSFANHNIKTASYKGRLVFPTLYARGNYLSLMNKINDACNVQGELTFFSATLDLEHKIAKERGLSMANAAGITLSNVPNGAYEVYGLYQNDVLLSIQMDVVSPFEQLEEDKFYSEGVSG